MTGQWDRASIAIFQYWFGPAMIGQASESCEQKLRLNRQIPHISGRGVNETIVTAHRQHRNRLWLASTSTTLHPSGHGSLRRIISKVCPRTGRNSWKIRRHRAGLHY